MPAAYPILEFDPAAEAIIEPGRYIKRMAVPPHCVICFFSEVLQKIVAQHPVRLLSENKWEDGPHRLYELDWHGRRLAFFHPGVGGPVAAGMLEEAIAVGCSRFIACGGAGVLSHDLAVEHLVIPTAAVRDEGTSYHYLAPSREVAANAQGVAAIEATLRDHQIPYSLGKTWTTDAPYRETAGKVSLRRSEGCLTVEMEAAAFFAVAAFRGVTLAQILYCGDDVSGETWDTRQWEKRTSVREQLFWLAAEACLRL